MWHLVKEVMCCRPIRNRVVPTLYSLPPNTANHTVRLTLLQKKIFGKVRGGRIQTQVDGYCCGSDSFPHCTRGKAERVSRQFGSWDCEGIWDLSQLAQSHRTGLISSLLSLRTKISPILKKLVVMQGVKKRTWVLVWASVKQKWHLSSPLRLAGWWLK